MCHVFADQARTKGMSRHPGVGPGVPLDIDLTSEPENRSRHPCRAARGSATYANPLPKRQIRRGEKPPMGVFLASGPGGPVPTAV